MEYAAPSGAGPTSSPAAYGPTSNTLDEPITDTIKRDLKRIYKNLVMVVFPFKDRSQQSAALRNWDLWGPMVGRGGSAGRGGRGRPEGGLCARPPGAVRELAWFPCTVCT